MSEDIDLSEIDKKYKDKCSLIKAGKCKNVNIFLQQSRENARLKEENVKLLFDKGTFVEFCNKLTQIIDKKKKSENKLLQTLQEIKAIANNIVYSDEIPACVNDKECPLNGGDGFDNHCNMRCPFILGKQILDLITKAEEE